MQGIALEEYWVTWESDLRSVIWVCETERKLERHTTIKKVHVKSARDVTHSMALIGKA